MESVSGIVLHTFPYQEKSFISKIFTQHYGIVPFFFPQVSIKGKIKPVYLQTFSFLELQFTKKQGAAFQKCHEMDFVTHSALMQLNPEKVTLFMLMAEIVLGSLHEYQNEDDLFDFLSKSVKKISMESHIPKGFALGFICQWIVRLGLKPAVDFDEFDLDNMHFSLREARFQYGKKMLNKEAIEGNEGLQLWKAFHDESFMWSNIDLSSSNRLSLIQAMVNYLAMHQGLQRHINTLDILKKIYS